MKFPSRTIEQTSYLVGVHDRPIPEDKVTLKRYLCEMGEENFLRYLQMRKADRGALAEPYRDISEQLSHACSLLEQVKGARECYSLRDLAVNGEDLENAFSVSGQQVGSLLQSALTAVIEEKCSNKKENIIQYLQSESKGDRL